jgi:membrane protein YdbS with pleckstrin-like domain
LIESEFPPTESANPVTGATYLDDSLVGLVPTDNEFLPLDPRVIRVEQIAGAIFTGVVGIAILIGLLVLWLSIGINWIWLSGLAGGVLIFALLLYLTICWPHTAYHNTKWRLDDEGLEIHRGVIWRHRISIPLGRVQHADVSQGPLQRPFEIGKLTVHTAGTSNASVELDGLPHTVALQLREVNDVV